MFNKFKKILHKILFVEIEESSTAIYDNVKYSDVLFSLETLMERISDLDGATTSQDFRIYLLKMNHLTADELFGRAPTTTSHKGVLISVGEYFDHYGRGVYAILLDMKQRILNNKVTNRQIEDYRELINMFVTYLE